MVFVTCYITVKSGAGAFFRRCREPGLKGGGGKLTGYRTPKKAMFYLTGFGF